MKLVKDAQLASQGGDNNSGAEGLEDPMAIGNNTNSSRKTSGRAKQETAHGEHDEDGVNANAVNANGVNANLTCLHNNLEWCLFLYAKQDPQRISNKSNECCDIFHKHFEPWIKELQEEETKTYEPIPTVPKDLLIVFCRQERLLRDVHEAFMWYLKRYDISEGLIVTVAGATAAIAKKSLAATSQLSEPNLRIFKAKSQLFYNLIRHHQDVPLYRRLNSYEVKILETKYGSRQHFPKLWKSATVCAVLRIPRRRRGDDAAYL